MAESSSGVPPIPFAPAVRPLFFHGQLLSAPDLTALVDWTREKLSLARHRDGWGVACGLEVEADPQDRSRVRVTPGYALSAAGEHIVVARPAGIDLSPLALAPRDGAAAAGDVSLGGPPVPRGDVRRVDLSIRYLEGKTALQAPLRETSCGQLVPCEYSRTLEQFRFDWEADPPGSPPDREADRWQAGFRTAEQLLRELYRDFPELQPGGSGRLDKLGEDDRTSLGRKLKDWLGRNLASQPAARFPWLGDHLRALQPGELARDKDLAALLFWLILDRRLGTLACACRRPDDAPPVPLARVWLRVTAAAGCSVLAVDAFPPFRRLLAPDGWPAPAGRVNLGQALWQTREEAYARLADLGIHPVSEEAFQVPDTLAGLADALRTELFVPPPGSGDAELVLQVLDAGALGRRVVAFTRPVARPPLGLETGKTSATGEAAPGAEVAYTYTVANTGQAPLAKVRLTDSLYGRIGPQEGISLAPGESRTFDLRFAVPANAQGALDTTVEAVGEAADGRTVRTAATHRLTVRRLDLRLVLEKRADLSAAYPWQDVTFHWIASNQDDVEMAVEIRDDQAGSVTGKSPVPVPPATDRDFPKVVRVPGEARNSLETRATATGRAGGREIRTEVRHTLPIRRPDDLALIGALQAWGSGVLKDPIPAYEAQVFTFTGFRDAETAVLQRAYERVLKTQADLGRSLVAEWQKHAGWLADAGIHFAEDAAARSPEDLARLFPKLSRKRIDRFLRLAREIAARQAPQWEPQPEENEEAQDEAPATPPPATSPEPPTPAPAAPTPEPAQPATPTAPPPVTPPPPAADDLSKIKGLGPVYIGKLQKAGIQTYDSLAKTSTPDLRKILGLSDENRLNLFKFQAGKLREGKA